MAITNEEVELNTSTNSLQNTMYISTSTKLDDGVNL
jgi:hypothetical protein